MDVASSQGSLEATLETSDFAHRGTFLVNVSGTLNCFLLIAGILVALMSCRGW